MDYPGIHNIGEFYSHHYLETLLEKDLRGLLAQWREDDETTPDQRLNRCATDFFAAKQHALEQRHAAERYAASHRLHVELLEALGYEYRFTLRYLRDGSALPLLSAVPRDGHDYLWLVETVFTADDESPLEQPVFPAQYQTPSPTLPLPGGGSKASPPLGGTEGGQNPPTPPAPWEELIGDIFASDEPPRWVILLGGRSIYLLDRAKWGRGQYLRFDLDEIFGRRERGMLRAAAALLSRDALCPGDSLPLHDTLDENSHKHAYAVSADLKDSLRHAVELLANEYVWYVREVRKEKLFGDDELGRRLTDECLTYLYRLLFLFYVEARSGELDVAPMKSEAYRTGYSLESLRDLELVPLNTPAAQNGYFLHESLQKLFTLVNDGYTPRQLRLGQEAGKNEPRISQISQIDKEKPSGQSGQSVVDFLTPNPQSLTPDLLAHGFTIEGLRSPLFDPDQTPLLSGVKFRNVILQEVLQRLSLSKAGQRGKTQRGRISYAQLGINQLGAVYEGLLSYSGFFAQEEMFAVKPAGAPDDAEEKYFITRAELERYEPDELVYEAGPDGAMLRQSHPPGSFIYRLAGRDREKSASYYTPEVLTQCLVKYSLKELLRPDMPAADILRLTLCEPAMGSGAFINEALNQLADAYLQRRQSELGRQIPADQYRDEKQRVKARLALHNAYGVDLKPLAVKLAQVSLWLNTLHPGQAAPWFNGRLVVGNSLIGARRQVYRAKAVLSGAYQQQAPEAVPLGQPRPEGSVYHWLLPAAGMAAFDRDKVIRELAPDEVQTIRAWRKQFTAKISPAELKNLQDLSDRADALWAQHTRERVALLNRTRESIAVWGQEAEAQQAGEQGSKGAGEQGEKHATRNTQHVPPNSQSAIRNSLSYSDKEAELAHLQRPTSPYRRLKLAMDYWCALWFWPIPEAASLPSRADYWNDLDAIFSGVAGSGFEKAPEQLNLFEAAPAPKQAHFADLRPASVAELTAANPRLRQAAALARRHTFHHWELAFAEVFAQRGGFDLVVGNPPWVKVKWNEGGLLSESDPLLSIRKVSGSQIAKGRNKQLENKSLVLDYLTEFAEATGTIVFLNEKPNYPLLQGIQTNLYKCFITQGWMVGNQNGILGLLHPESVYDDPKGGILRAEIYPRLHHHFQFHNELNLFAEVDHHTMYSVNIYQAAKKVAPDFIHIVNLFHPSTVDLCFSHDGAGKVPGIRNENDEWSLVGHKSRITQLDSNSLKLFASLYDPAETPPLEAHLPAVHSEEIVQVLRKFAQQPKKLGDIQNRYYTTEMWHETYAQRDATIERNTEYPQRIEEWIVSGPHFHVATPLNKEPNENCRHNLDYSDIDLTAIPDDFLPRTNYVPACSSEEYLSRTPKWKGQPVTNSFRHLHRKMLSQTGERTLINAIIPPGAGNIFAAFSINFDSNRLLVEFSGLCSSVVYDFFIKSTGKSNMLNDLASLLPLPEKAQSLDSVIARTLRLNCLTTHYAALWAELYRPAFNRDGWAKADPRLAPWAGLTSHWQRDVALRTPFERRQALVEIDVLAALALDLTLEELLTIYRVQFPVLQKNERRLLFDARGMEVPVKTTAGLLAPDETHERFGEMVEPFTGVDREADYRQAWAYFEERLKE